MSKPRGTGSLRVRLTLLSGLLLALPLAGVGFLQQAEQMFREQLAASNFTAAHAIATTLDERGSLLSTFIESRAPRSIVPVAITEPLQLDGYPSDWTPFGAHAIALMPHADGVAVQNAPVVNVILAYEGAQLYLLLDVQWPHDHSGLRLNLSTIDIHHRQRNYRFDFAGSGLVEAFEWWLRDASDAESLEGKRREHRIAAFGQTTGGVGSLEVRVPRALIGQELSISLTPLPAVEDSSPPEWHLSLGAPAAIVIPTSELEELIRGFPAGCPAHGQAQG